MKPFSAKDLWKEEGGKSSEEIKLRIKLGKKK